MFTKIQDLHVKTPKSAHRERTLRGPHRIRHAQSDERLTPTNVRISPSTARTTKGETSKWVSGTVSRGLSRVLRLQKWAWGISSRAGRAKWSSCSKLKMTTVFDKTRVSPKLTKCSPNTAPATPIPSHTCQPSSNVQELLRLPRGWTSVESLAPVMENDLPDLKMTVRTPQCSNTVWGVNYWSLAVKLIGVVEGLRSRCIMLLIGDSLVYSLWVASWASLRSYALVWYVRYFLVFIIDHP